MSISSPKFLIPVLAIIGLIFALTVSAVDDTTPPSAVSSLAVASTTDASVGLTWTAPGDDGAVGTAASYDVRYRTTGPLDEINFATSTAVAGEPVPHVAGTLESMTVVGLSPTTTYWFALRATDDAGNTSALSNVVSTMTPADTTAPVISSVNVSNITSSSARVSWMTNESATSQVDYGSSISYGSSTASSTLVTSHVLDLSLLLPSTLYHFFASSTDAHGNTATSSDATFTTLATTTPDTTPPSISGITVTDIGTTSATVHWNTNESANSLVRYGTTTAYGLSANSASLVTAHAMPLFSLAPATLYHFSASSADASGNTATSSDHTFTTLATSTPTTTIAARLRVEPRVLNRKREGRKITAVVRLPKGTNFRGLDLESIRLNDTAKPIKANLRPKEWKRWGHVRRTLVLKFAAADVLPLIPSTTDSFVMTVTGNIKAGKFQGTDTVRIIPPAPRHDDDDDDDNEDRIERRIEEAKERLEKRKEELKEREERLKEQMEKKQEQLKKKEEKLKEQFKKNEEKLKGKIEKLKDRFDD